MEYHHKTLGIYAAQRRACAVLVGKAAETYEILNSFSVSVDEQDESPYSTLAAAIAQKCQEQGIVFSDVAVGLDCMMFSQQNLQSEFNDSKQIAQTIKFDAEEALAVDALEIAIAFEIVNKAQDGSEVAVFATGRDMLSEIISALQINNLDPVTMEPDVVCLRRFVSELTDDGQENSGWAAVSNKNCYLISSDKAKEKSIVRTFLTSPQQDKNALLLREMIMTSASSSGQGPEVLRVFDTSEQVNCDELAGKLAIEVQERNLADLLKSSPAEDENIDSLEMVIAAGAAIGQLTRTDKVDFRPDFMPYQGKRVVAEKTLKILSMSISAVLLALGLYLQLQMVTTNRYRGKLRTKFKNEYSIAMPGQKFPRTENPVSKLKREKTRIEKVKAGFLSAGGDDSVGAKLTFLLEALNNTPAEVDLDIGTISVTTKSMSVMGSTSRGGRLKLFGSIDKHPKLQRGQTKYESKNNRENIRMTVGLKQ